MLRVLLLLLLVALAGCAAAVRGSSQCAWRVCVAYADGPAGRDYTATNEEPVPVTVTMTFRSAENLRLPDDRSLEVIVPARSRVHLAHLETLGSERPTGAVVMIQIDLGASANEVDDAFVYGVPFGGEEPRELLQGFDGDETHLGSMRYSLDFAMPEGTPVLAAREGQVLLLQDGFTRGGISRDLLERANLVVIAHSDGSMASYGHLQRGLRVRVGQRVREGQLLGYSGSTGYAGQPHLHFHVGKRMLGEPGRTIPIVLRDQEGRAVSLEKGSLVQPAVRRAPRPRG